MEDTKLQEGDIVRLKSGGPKMTIDQIAIYEYEDRKSAMCAWFDGTKQYTERFQLHSLELAKD